MSRLGLVVINDGNGMGQASEQRKSVRVEFSQGLDGHIVAIDGTWNRPCTLLDVSDDGARLKISTSVEGLGLKEFFLLLSTTHAAYRRCELAWVNGEQLGVTFFKAGKKKTLSTASR